MFGQIWRLLSDSVQAFVADDALSRGASISFYTITSMGPVLFIVVVRGRRDHSARHCLWRIR
jgi:uncharacterized BrkB/YihY/UPF0761 family membrane protein